MRAVTGLVVAVVALAAACGTADPETSTSRATDATVDVQTSATSTNRPPVETTESHSTTSVSSPSAALPMDFDDLFAQLADLVGSTVDVTGTVFFVASCPPPDGTTVQPCVLSGYLAASGLDDLTNADAQTEAIALTEGGDRLSCPEDPAVAGGGCAGWIHASPYRIVGTVSRSIDGSDTVRPQLDVIEKQPL